MATIPPWTPPVGNSWNPIELYTRIMQGRKLDVGEGDQNKTSAEDAINWIGNKIFEILAQIGSSHVTGDIRVSFYPTATEGWILLDGRTVGSASSGSNLTGVTYQPLYEVLWNYATNSDLLTSAGSPTTKGASAVADFSANKRLILPDARGRTIVGAGAGAGLTNRLIMSRFGVEGGSLNHNHAVLITTTASLGSYTPEGTVTVENASPEFTPQGTVSVASFTGNITPLGSVTVNTATLSATPSGTVTVTLNNNPLTVTGTGKQAVDGITCVNVAPQSPPGERSVIDCASNLEIDLTTMVSQLETSVTVASASFSGATQSLNHTHTATFTGSPTSINHGHSATFTGTTANILHNHSASFTGEAEVFTHDHEVAGNAETTELSYTTVQPSIAYFIYIKL